MMLVSVLGTVGSGKTVTSDATLEQVRKKWPKAPFEIIHTDIVRAKMRDADPEHNNPIIHSSFLEANKFSNLPGYAAYWEGWVKQAIAILPEVVKEAQQHFDEGKNVICEGVAMIPPFYARFFPEGLKLVHANLLINYSDTLAQRITGRGRLGDGVNKNDAEKLKNIPILLEFEHFLKTCSLQSPDIFSKGFLAAAKTPIEKKLMPINYPGKDPI